jgi:hypothetical protein
MNHANYNKWLQEKLASYNYPNTGLGRPVGFQEVEAPRISRHAAHEGGKVQPYGPAAFTPQEISLVLISLDAESTTGPQFGRKD